MSLIQEEEIDRPIAPLATLITDQLTSLQTALADIAKLVQTLGKQELRVSRQPTDPTTSFATSHHQQKPHLPLKNSTLLLLLVNFHLPMNLLSRNKLGTKG